MFLAFSLLYHVTVKSRIAGYSPQSETFFLGGMDVHAHLFNDHNRVSLFFHFAVGLDGKIILTVKFSRSTACDIGG